MLFMLVTRTEYCYDFTVNFESYKFITHNM